MDNNLSTTNKRANIAINAESITHTTINWNKINSEWEKSDLSQTAFCKITNTNYQQFVYQRARLKQETKNHQIAPKLLPVKIQHNTNKPSHNEPFILYYPNGLKLTIPNGADEHTLKQLLNYLEIR